MSYQQQQREFTPHINPRAFSHSHVAVGSMVRLAGMATVMACAAKIKDAETRWLIISMVGVAASFAELVSRQHQREEREKHGRAR